MTTRRYLRSFERWPLNPMQWEQLSDDAVLRFGRFPSISELYEIACELQQKAQIRTNSEWLAKLRHDWQRNRSGQADQTAPEVPPA